MKATGHRSPNLDPVFLLTIAAVIAVLAFTGWTWVRPWVAVASLHCPAPDHSMWAPSIGKAICGETFTAGAKTVTAK